MDNTKASECLQEIIEVLKKYDLDINKIPRKELTDDEYYYIKIKKIFGILKNFNKTDERKANIKVDAILGFLKIDITEEKKESVKQSIEEALKVIGEFNDIDKSKVKRKYYQVLAIFNKFK
ncbi:MAG: hypothetical protein PHS62_01265 [Patescibacteria group bacterium]|nr:hypothetical protein [Patescibacteria group bacterium]